MANERPFGSLAPSDLLLNQVLLQREPGLEHGVRMRVPRSAESGAAMFGEAAVPDRDMSLLDRFKWAGTPAGGLELAANILGGPALGRTVGKAVGPAFGSLARPPGIQGWHGSPHLFTPEPGAPHGRFRADKIGTGEGAQSYGYGHYIGGNEAVARYYRDTLAPSRGKLPDEVISMPPDMRRALHTHAGTAVDPQVAARRAQYMSPELRSVEVPKIAEMIEGIREARRGHMYEVDINAKPAQFLNYDATIGEQSPYVRQRLRELGLGGRGDAKLDASDVYHNWGRPVETAETFSEVGIPGIRYLDQGSRGVDALRAQLARVQDSPPPPGMTWASRRQQLQDEIAAAERAQTSNYVMFPGNEPLVDILRRYALPGAAAIPAFGSLAPSDQ